MELAAAGKLFGSVAQAVAPVLLKKVNSKLNPTDIKNGLVAGMKAAFEREKPLPPQQWLFFRSEPDFVQGFLQKFFQTEGVQQELQKPLKNQGRPAVDFLVEKFKQVAAGDRPFGASGANRHITPQDSCILPWIEAFVKTYVQKTDNYLRLQIAKEDYFRQLANWFDDVKFAGIAVPGQEVDKSEQLAQIFVMPDVAEDRRSSNAWEQELVLAVASNRQEELPQEQRQRVLKENSSGRKMLAQQLLTHSKSGKLVILGAPGSGKTTL